MLKRGLQALLCTLTILTSMACYAIPPGCYSASLGQDTTFHVNNITLRSGSHPNVGDIIYTSPAYTIQYQCQAGDYSATTYRANLVSLPDFNVLRDQLRNAGLALRMLVNDGIWYSGQLLITPRFHLVMQSLLDRILRFSPFVFNFRLKWSVRLPMLSAFPCPLTPPLKS